MSNSVSLWKRLRRTPYQALAAVTMMFITLFVMAVIFILIAGSSAILTYFESKPQLTVFFKNEKEKSSIDELSEKLKSTGKVASMTYTSKEQALAIYKEQNKNDPLLLEMVTADILPSSLDVAATSPKFLSELADLINKESGIDEVVFQKDLVDSLISWTTLMRKIGLIFIGFLTLSTFFILLTSIGMKIAMKKEEIEILKLVGATSWYIKRPFITEGIIYGITGAVFSWLTITFLLAYFHSFLASFLKGISTLAIVITRNFTVHIWPLNLPFQLILLILLVIIGLTIGFLGSFFATSHYMKD